nr:MAG TPA: hypothetical protein [Caudoviricetes sp.]
MAAFKFQNSIVSLEICEHKYEIDTTSKPLADNLQQFAWKALKMSTDLQSAADKKESEEVMGAMVEEGVQFVLSSIDAILGQDAAKQIFEGRIVTLEDACDVITYIIKEIEAARAKRMERYKPGRERRK